MWSGVGEVICKGEQGATNPNYELLTKPLDVNKISECLNLIKVNYVRYRGVSYHSSTNHSLKVMNMFAEVLKLKRQFHFYKSLANDERNNIEVPSKHSLSTPWKHSSWFVASKNTLHHFPWIHFSDIIPVTRP